MAKRRSRRRAPKIQPAQLNLFYEIENGVAKSHIDTQRDLSRVNRRLYDQGRLVAYQGLTFIWRNVGAVGISNLEIKVRTAGNTWVVQNAFVKGKALWNQMQALVLDDNPSLAGKWHDFKVTLHNDMIVASTLDPLDGNGVPYTMAGGEWLYSFFVLPQHEVDGAGVPKPAEQVTVDLIGDDGSSSRSLVKAYQLSRATVQSPMPNVPGGMSASFFNLLTDTGSQEPELADRIEDENDQPPYDVDDYPQGAGNAPEPVIQGYAATSSAEVDGRIGPFVAPCGLLEIEMTAFDVNGAPIAPSESWPDIGIILHVAPGMYKGTASIPMGQ